MKIVLLLCLFGLNILTAQNNSIKKKDAYPFVLKDTLGFEHKLEDYKGKTIIMDFWFTGCKGCVQLAKKLHEVVIPHFKNDDTVVFIAVSLDINFLKWKESIKKEIYSSPPEINLYTMGMENKHPLFKYYGFSGCPQLLIINSNGKLVSSSPPNSGEALVKLIENCKF